MASWPGSSPRVRGTQFRGRGEPLLHRFIPACAGNTYPSSATPRRNPVHPRVCGEHGPVLTPREARDGSSPRVRGTRLANRRPHFRQRFIPACAGNTPQ